MPRPQQALRPSLFARPHPGRSRRIAALLASTLACVACGPIGPFAGGYLRGDVGPASMSDWAPVSGEELAQLETRPDDPHSVNTWFVTLGPSLYIPTSMILGPKNPTERGWVAHVRQNDAVRVRIAGTVYERRAVRVEGEEYDRARAALESKYELDPEDRDPERTIWIFRMDPRSG